MAPACGADEGAVHPTIPENLAQFGRMHYRTGLVGLDGHLLSGLLRGPNKTLCRASQ